MFCFGGPRSILARAAAVADGQVLSAANYGEVLDESVGAPGESR
jgi:hypothetical protein